MSILYPGQDWRGSVLNTLDKTLADKSDNKNYPTYTDNASKSSLTWAKYLDTHRPVSQYVEHRNLCDRVPVCRSFVVVCRSGE